MYNHEFLVNRGSPEKTTKNSSVIEIIDKLTLNKSMDMDYTSHLKSNLE